MAAGRGLGRWFDGYNAERPHQALGYATPAEVYFAPDSHGAKPATWEAMRPRDGGRGHKVTSAGTECEEDRHDKKTHDKKA